MKKLLLFLFFGTTIFFTAQAGYVIRGINVSFSFNNLKNYTLTIDGEGTPRAAASLHTNLGISMGRNTIAIIPADQNPLFVPCFPVFQNLEEDFDIEVRDFHYISNNTYVLCGARITKEYSHAFVAVIDLGALPVPLMNYMEYPEAEIFYSICVPRNSTEFFVCGEGNNHGVIASINRSNLNFTHFYTTDTEWEYHKIIEKSGINLPQTFVVSGRNSEYTRIGFTMFDAQFNTIRSYMWSQNTEQESHCVVCNHSTEYYKIVLASSYQTSVTLYSVTLSSFTPQISAYHYSLPGSINAKYCVQDIGMFNLDDVFNPAVSVAGYIRQYDALYSHQKAWYGVTGLDVPTLMHNKNYSLLNNGLYDFYKIRYDQHGELYTGGYFEDGSQMCALFGTPYQTANDCEIEYESEFPSQGFVSISQYTLTPHPYLNDDFITFNNQPQQMDAYDICDPFKSVETPELAPPHNETEIITYYDRITLKDTPTNTNYQIYNIMGQLIQAGTTNPDISTAQLNKGIYILRLENGKAFKFVK